MTARLQKLSRWCYRPWSKPGAMHSPGFRTRRGWHPAGTGVRGDDGQVRLFAGPDARRGWSGRFMIRRNGIASSAVWVVWLVTRTVLYLRVTAPHMDGDVGIYQRWYACCLVHGTFPVGDPMWQYPPGAALVFWLAGR